MFSFFGIFFTILPSTAPPRVGLPFEMRPKSDNFAAPHSSHVDRLASQSRFKMLKLFRIDSFGSFGLLDLAEQQTFFEFNTFNTICCDISAALGEILRLVRLFDRDDRDDDLDERRRLSMGTTG